MKCEENEGEMKSDTRASLNVPFIFLNLTLVTVIECFQNPIENMK